MNKKCFYLEFDDPHKDFDLSISDRPILCRDCEKPSIPEWARLCNNQCPVCVLADTDVQYCPAASDMAGIVEHFSAFNSYDRVTMHMWTNSEMHAIRTDMQNALAYLYIAILAASSCPHAHLLSAIGKFAKPFPDIDDMFFYFLSFGLISKYLRKGQENRSKVLELEKPNTIGLVFHGLLQRAKQISLSDASINALAKNMQWSYVSLQPEDFFGSELEKYFPCHQEGMVCNME